MNPARPAAAALAAAAAVTLLAACSSSGSAGSPSAPSSVSTAPTTPADTATSPAGTSTTSSATPTGPAASVEVKNFTFSPAALTVAPGTTVTWRFDDSVAHNVTATGHAFGSATLNNGATFAFTFHKPGTYAYICTIHPYMKASVTVR